jgi:spore coat protein A
VTPGNRAAAPSGPRRRTVLRAAGLAGLAAGAGGLAGCSSSKGQTGEVVVSRASLPEPFTRPLPRPAVLTPTSTAGGVDTFRVTARVADAEILPGVRTRIIGYDGTFPGPTIETRSGRAAVVEHVNELPVPMVVHLHGGEVPAASDGFPTDLVLPAPGFAGRMSAHAADHTGTHTPDARADVVQGSRRYEYPMDQPGATLWYHDHRMDFTGPMVYRGLAGFHIVRDDDEDALPLPRGEREVPLMIADRSFDGDGQFDYPAKDPTMTREPGVRNGRALVAGVLGDVILVNGVPWPRLEVDAARYRLRILNASNARRYGLVLDPPPPSGDSFTQVGSDGGLLERPVGHDELLMAPAERFDVVVDFSAYPVGTQVVLRNRLGDGRTGAVMRFVVARRAADDSRVPALLRPYETLTPPPGATRRAFRFRRGSTGAQHLWRINGEAFDPNRPIAQVPAGRIERWRFATDLHHPVHVHLAQFQVLSRGGGRPRPSDGGWKDTVDLRPVEDVEVAIRFPDIPGRYVMHCHNLEHEDMAMMAAFEVV